jgi:hypothetical protein
MAGAGVADGRSGATAALVLAAVVGGAFGGFLAARLAAGPPAAPVAAGAASAAGAEPPGRLPADLTTAPGAAAGGASLITLGDGYVLHADGAGQLFLLRFRPAGSRLVDRPETLEVVRTYALRQDRQRHALDPGARSPHGFYLDDLALEGEEAVERAHDLFAREVLSGAVDADADRRLEVYARASLAAGDASFLRGQLEGTPWSARRAAALVLGEHGFRVAAPMLMELVEADGDDRERAARLLAHVAGRAFADRAAFDTWWAGLDGPGRAVRAAGSASAPEGQHR